MSEFSAVFRLGRGPPTQTIRDSLSAHIATSPVTLAHRGGHQDAVPSNLRWDRRTGLFHTAHRNRGHQRRTRSLRQGWDSDPNVMDISRRQRMLIGHTTQGEGSHSLLLEGVSTEISMRTEAEIRQIVRDEDEFEK